MQKIFRAEKSYDSPFIGSFSQLVLYGYYALLEFAETHLDRFPVTQIAQKEQID